MQVDGVETQVVREAVDLPRAIVIEKARRQRLEGALEVRLAAPGGARRPETGIERDSVGADRIEARELLGAGDHLDQRPQAR